MSDQKRNYFLAFPGIGKSYLAERDPAAVDVDFGLFRDSLGVSKDKEDTLFEPFAKYIESMTSYGENYFTNEPKLVSFIKFKLCYLPDPALYARCAEKLSVNTETIASWVEGWERVAKANLIPVVHIKEGLYRYFQLYKTAKV